MKPIIMSTPSNTQTMFEQMMMRRFRGKQEPVRFANRPAWLKAELLDKAVKGTCVTDWNRAMGWEEQE